MITPPAFNKIIPGDTLKVLRSLPDECVDCIVTSPPYYALRDYGVDGQIGLEKSLDEYLERMLAVTAELKRVLKSTGTMWWNHGDAYSSKPPGNKVGQMDKQLASGDGVYGRLIKRYGGDSQKWKPQLSIAEKSLLFQAHRLAIRMIDEQGWILRNQIIWHKPNCMPSSVKDRFTVDYEPIFFFTKSKKYWFEMQHEPMVSNNYDLRRMKNGRKTYNGKWSIAENGSWNSRRIQNAFVGGHPGGRNKRCVWKISSKPFKEAHFATFPEALIETPIKAGCPEMICKRCAMLREKLYKRTIIGKKSSGTSYADEKMNANNLARKRQAYRELGLEGPPPPLFIGYNDCKCNAGFAPGIVLDPFMGAGTTAVVAERLGRRWLGIELNSEYIKIAERRILESRYQILKPIKSKPKKFQPIEPNEEAV